MDYQVTDADNATVTTALLAVREGDTSYTRIGYSVPMKTFVEGTAGNVGANQPTGVTRHVTCNMPADWAVDYTNMQVEALARDSRNLLGVHWITVPASGGQAAFQASSAPISDTLLRDLWLWFMANGQGVATTYVNDPQLQWLGTIRGTTGAYTGVKFAEDVNISGVGIRTVTTSAGRLFALEQMGARPISGSEKIRGQAGKFGFTSVDDNTIVKVSGTPTSYLKGWGSNTFGEANWFSFSAPNISKIAARGNSTLFLTSDGTLWGLGKNNFGQLGDGTVTPRTAPVIIASGVTQLSCGDKHSAFIKSDGTLWTMGYNGFGQLGDGTTTNRSTPVQAASSVSLVSASGGEDFGYTLFIKTDGTLWGMGYNGNGNLGDGTITQRPNPVQITTGVAQCAAGHYHSLFVKTNGTLWAMGNNQTGQLGDGTTTQRNSPVQVATGVSVAAAGGHTNVSGNQVFHSLFVKTDGSLWAMGSNMMGQLGDGTTTQRNSPVQITTGVVEVSAGQGHSVFRKTNNTVWSMGYNTFGQLGDGLTVQRTTPFQFDTNASGIAAGGNHTVTFTIP